MNMHQVFDFRTQTRSSRLRFLVFPKRVQFRIVDFAVGRPGAMHIHSDQTIEIGGRFLNKCIGIMVERGGGRRYRGGSFF